VHPRWLNSSVAGIGAASFLDDVGKEISTSLLPSFLTTTLGAPAAALGAIEGVADGMAGAAKLAGGALADDPARRRATAMGGYSATAVLNALIGAAGAVWQVGVLRTGAWLTRGLRTPSRNALLTDVVPREAYGRAYGFERAMDNLGAIAGPLLALGLVAVVGVREAILLSVVPGFLAAAAIFVAIAAAPRLARHERPPLRLRVRPEAELRGKARKPERPERIVLIRLRADHPQGAGFDVRPASERVHEVAALGGPGNRVDGEVPLPQVLLDRRAL